MVPLRRIVPNLSRKREREHFSGLEKGTAVRSAVGKEQGSWNTYAFERNGGPFQLASLGLDRELISFPIRSKTNNRNKCDRGDSRRRRSMWIFSLACAISSMRIM